MQPEYQTVGQMHERLLAMIRSRRDTGFSAAVADEVLEPRNPFDATKRRPKLAVAVAASMALLFVAVFTYFSLHSGK